MEVNAAPAPDASVRPEDLETTVTFMRKGFETLGNATLVFYENGKPVLATDPWLEGRCYSGSWALERKVTDTERQAVMDADYIWISHGHPDHFHIQSLSLLPRGKKILLPDHYAPDIAKFLIQQGFAVEVMPYRTWKTLSPGLRCMCLDNENQDAILLIEAGDSLVVNLNDSPLCGDEGFIRDIVRGYPRAKTYMAALCSNDADMMNLVDETGRRTVDAPDVRKPGMVWALGRIARRLGVGAYVCSASQHVYARADSVWANPYRMGWGDVCANWNEPDIGLVQPFVTVDLDTGAIAAKDRDPRSDLSQIQNDLYGDDWDERLSNDEWGQLNGFFGEIELLPRCVDYLDFTVGGETRRIWINPRAMGEPEAKLRGIGFEAPRQSLMKSLRYGYFDDMLIGNFMRTRLHNVSLYPHFTPIVAKLRGSAKVKTVSEHRAFMWRYFRRNPIGYIGWHAGQKADALTDYLRRLSDAFGVKRPLKYVYRRLLGDPVR